MRRQVDGTRETVIYPGNTGARVYDNARDEGYPLHWHAAIEVIMPLKGNYVVRVSGQEIVLRPGHICWLAPGTLHEIQTPEPGGRRLIMLTDPRFMGRFHEIRSLLPLLSPWLKVTGREHDLGGAHFHKILKEILLRILENEAAPSPFQNVLTGAEVMRFTGLLGNAVIESRVKHAAADDEPLSDGREAAGPALQKQVSAIYAVCEYIQEHAAANLTLEDLAEQAGFSKFYFSRLFKQVAGMSFVDYLNACRVDEVERRLFEKDTSITEIALASGFNNISTFNRVFKKLKNCTPLEFKRLMLKEYS